MMRFTLFIVAVFCFIVRFSLEWENHNLTFIIISQNAEHNEKLAKQLENSLKQQFQEFGLDESKIYISNKHFPNTPADWTITPLITPILEVIEKGTQWIVFLEDRTSVVLKTLFETLEKYDSGQELWIGHALHDSEATIIHHFAFYEDPKFFKYPNFGSGMALSVPMLKRLKSLIEAGFKQQDFHIDPAHEFALFVYQEGNGTLMQHENSFCCKEGPNCSTYPRNTFGCGKADISSIYFAIKTCHKFHGDRVRAVKSTWHKHALKSAFFSDIEDPDIPTKSLGIPNTEQGHCQKTRAIFQHSLKEFEGDVQLQWVVLVDDDTILSVSRLARLVTCYQNSSQPMILGERYRFGARGFDYPTGGAGIIINRAALDILGRSFNCPRPDSPDDMVLGACARDFGVTLVHVPQMHQARPADYALGRLATNDAISFHKHWMIDPEKIYQQWFLTDDEDFLNNVHLKTEL